MVARMRLAEVSTGGGLLAILLLPAQLPIVGEYAGAGIAGPSAAKIRYHVRRTVPVYDHSEKAAAYETRTGHTTRGHLDRGIAAPFSGGN